MSDDNYKAQLLLELTKLDFYYQMMPVFNAIMNRQVRSAQRRKVVKALAMYHKISEIEAWTGIKKTTLSVVIKRLVEDNLVEKIKRGKYRLKDPVFEGWLRWLYRRTHPNRFNYPPQSLEDVHYHLEKELDKLLWIDLSGEAGI